MGCSHGQAIGDCAACDLQDVIVHGERVDESEKTAKRRAGYLVVPVGVAQKAVDDLAALRADLAAAEKLSADLIHDLDEILVGPGLSIPIDEAARQWVEAAKMLARQYEAAIPVVKAALDLRNSGYDGPFIGPPVEDLFTALAAYERDNGTAERKFKWRVARYVEKDGIKQPSAYVREGSKMFSDVYLDVTGRWNAWEVPAPVTFATAEEAMAAADAERNKRE